MTTTEIKIRKRSFQDRLSHDINYEHVLYVNGGQEGLYTTEKSAKGGARRFVHSTDRIRWQLLNDQDGPYFKAVIR